jgi:beta-lactamase class A
MGDMTFSPQRRSLLLAAASLPVAGGALATPDEAVDARFGRAMKQLEASSGGRLGVALLMDGSKHLSYRGNQRFPMCSTFKVVAAAAVLAKGGLDKRIRYRKADLVSYSPVTEKHVANGMTLAELCAAAIQYSDNTAGNLLMKQLGGPAGLTAFARSLGDQMFRIDRWETELNTAIPGDERDTTTPLAMVRSLHALALGNGLATSAQRTMLVDWMLGNTTGAARIRAGVPAGWRVADKTGSGSYGSTNTIAILYPPGQPPMTMAVYFTQPRQDADTRSDVVAAAAKVVAQIV